MQYPRMRTNTSWPLISRTARRASCFDISQTLGGFAQATSSSRFPSTRQMKRNFWSKNGQWTKTTAQAATSSQQVASSPQVKASSITRFVSSRRRLDWHSMRQKADNSHKSPSSTQATCPMLIPCHAFTQVYTSSKLLNRKLTTNYNSKNQKLLTSSSGPKKKLRTELRGKRATSRTTSSYLVRLHPVASLPSNTFSARNSSERWPDFKLS